MSDSDDPKGLIREAYRIEGITPPECRSVFLDWALSLPEGADSRAALARLHARHGTAAPDHAMTAILAEGLRTGGGLSPRRRGGRGGRGGSGGGGGRPS